MKMRMIAALAAVIILFASIPVYAGPFDYSEETKALMREAGLDPEPKEWEEINRRQIEYQNRKNNKKRVSISHNVAGQYSGQSGNYGTKYSYDEFHTAPRDIPANDGYKSGNFDELHINERYIQNVWHPEDRSGRMEGFDEFHFPDEF